MNRPPFSGIFRAFTSSNLVVASEKDHRNVVLFFLETLLRIGVCGLWRRCV